MAIRLIALDLDDTLLTPDLTISPQTEQVLGRAMAQGVRVVIATGRMLPSALPYVRQLGLTTPVILCQGAVVVDPVTGRTLRHMPVPVDQARAILDELQRMGVYCQFYQGEDYYFSKFGVHSELYRVLARHAGREVGYPLSAAVTAPPDKLLLIDEPERLPGIKAHLAEGLCQGMTLAESKPYYLEINHAQANKGAALAFVAETLGVAQEEVMAIGDSTNDIPMIRWAGLGGCMGSGRQAAKDAADFVTEDNAHDGVACAVRRYLWGEEL